MTFKALLYKCYVRRGHIGAESKEQGSRAPLEFAFLENLGHLGLGSNNNVQIKLLLKCNI